MMHQRQSSPSPTSSYDPDDSEAELGMSGSMSGSRADGGGSGSTVTAGLLRHSYSSRDEESNKSKQQIAFAVSLSTLLLVLLLMFTLPSLIRRGVDSSLSSPASPINAAIHAINHEQEKLTRSQIAIIQKMTHARDGSKQNQQTMSNNNKDIDMEAETTTTATLTPSVSTSVPSPALPLPVSNPLTDPNVLTFVTSSNSGYFPQLLNFLSSVHFYALSHPLLVYDLGLTAQQKHELTLYRGLTLIDIDEWSGTYKATHPHLLNIGSFAWKPVVMLHALTTVGVGMMWYQDAGGEIHRYPDRIDKQLHESGYFYVSQEGLRTGLRCCGPVLELTHQGSIEALGFQAKEFEGKYMCAGGLQGYRWTKELAEQYNDPDSPYYAPNYKNAVELVLKPAVKCALNKACITPSGSSLANHRQDQSVFSLLVNHHGLTIEKDIRYWGQEGAIMDFKDPLDMSDDTIYPRRRHWGKPFFDYAAREVNLALGIVWRSEEELGAIKEKIAAFSAFLPCSTRTGLGALEHGSTVDLVMIGRNGADDKDDSEQTTAALEKEFTDLLHALPAAVQRCFRRVRFIRPPHPLIATPAQSIHTIFLHESYNFRFAYGYTHLLLLQLPFELFRPYWLDGVMSEILNENRLVGRVRMGMEDDRPFTRTDDEAKALVSNTLYNGLPGLPGDAGRIYTINRWWMKVTSIIGSHERPHLARHTIPVIFHFSNQAIEYVRGVWPYVEEACKKDTSAAESASFSFSPVLTALYQAPYPGGFESNLASVRDRLRTSPYGYGCYRGKCQDWHWTWLEQPEAFIKREEPI